MTTEKTPYVFVPKKELESIKKDNACIKDKLSTISEKLADTELDGFLAETNSDNLEMIVGKHFERIEAIISSDDSRQSTKSIKSHLKESMAIFKWERLNRKPEGYNGRSNGLSECCFCGKCESEEVEMTIKSFPVSEIKEQDPLPLSYIVNRDECGDLHTLLECEEGFCSDDKSHSNPFTPVNGLIYYSVCKQCENGETSPEEIEAWDNFNF